MEQLKQYISWRRVSTKKQGASGLGLEAQTDIISYFTKDGELIADYSETYTGKDLNGCTELHKAISHCKKTGATLVIAKTDRFRNVKEALQVLDELPNQIMFCDLPHSDRFTLILFFALAEREALLVSIRTKAALKAKKAREGNWMKEYGKHTGAKIEDTIKNAREQSIISRKKAAMNNKQNIMFWAYITQFKENNQLNTSSDFNKLSNYLNDVGLTTSTGLEFNSNRARAMFAKCERLYNN